MTRSADLLARFRDTLDDDAFAAVQQAVLSDDREALQAIFLATVDRQVEQDVEHIRQLIADQADRDGLG